MKNTILILISMLISTSCTGQRVQSGAYDLMLRAMLEHSVDDITVDSLEKVQDEVVLLDACSKEEFEVSHIKNARFVGYENFDS